MRIVYMKKCFFLFAVCALFFSSCSKKSVPPDNAVLFEGFGSGAVPAGWNGTLMEINHNAAVALMPIDNKYFGVGAWYQPEKPIMRYAGAPVVRFRYFAGAASFIYVSYFNETQNDHFHFNWRSITPHTWETAEIPLDQFKDNEYAGKRTAEGDVITRLNFFTGKPGQKPLVFIDDITIFIPDSTYAAAQENILPKRFVASFENDSSGWSGVHDSALPGNRTGSAMRSQPVQNDYFGAKIAYEPADKVFVVDDNPNTRPILTFSYYLKSKTNLYVSLFNTTKDDNFSFEVKNTSEGEWKTVKRNILTLSDNSNRGVPVSEGDIFSNIRFFAGKPGSTVDFWIDDVSIEMQNVEKGEEFDISQRAFARYILYDRAVIQHLRSIYSANTAPKSIMTFGDSISESMAFVAPLRYMRDGMLIGQGYSYVDKSLCAKSNQQSEWGRRKIDGALKAAMPEFVTILFGTNDILQGVPPGNYYANMEYIVDACLKNGSIPVLLTIPPTTAKDSFHVLRLNYFLFQIARDRKIPIVDIYRLFTDQPDWKKLLSDGVHPTFFETGEQGGYNLMNDILFETYKTLELETMPRVGKVPSLFIESLDYSLPDQAQILFKFDFEASAQGWSGIYSATPGSAASTKCIRLEKRRELEAELGINFRVLRSTYIAVTCYAVDCPRMRVQLNNQTQKDNFWAAKERIPQQTWTTLYFDLNKDFQDNEHLNKEIQFNDLLDTLQVYAEIVSDKTMLYIDDVIVYNATPESYTVTLQQSAARLGEQLAGILFDAQPNHPLVQQASNLLSDIKRELEPMPANGLVQLAQKIDTLEQTVQTLNRSVKMREAFGIDSVPFFVGYASPMVRISPYHPELPFIGTITNRIRLNSAQHESEHFQLYLEPLDNETRTVSLAFSDLRREQDNETISASNLSWFIEEYVTTKPSWPIPKNILGKKPDPLLPGMPFECNEPKLLWVSAYVPAGTPVGDYTGTLSITGAETPLDIVVTIHVWDFELPRAGRLMAPSTFELEALEKYYGRQPTPTERRRWYKFLLDHRLDPISLYHFGMHPHQNDIEFCESLGQRIYVLGGHHYNVSIQSPNSTVAYYNILKERGVLDKSMLFIADKPPLNAAEYENLRNKANWVRENCPGLKTFSGSDPRPELIGYVDVWDPVIYGMGAELYDTNEWDYETCRARQKEGEQVMWYVAAVPSYPYPNVHIDSELIESRIMFWMTWKYQIDGWEYYYVNLWASNFYGKGGKKWPDVPWDPYSFLTKINNYNGDGLLIYPGPDMVPYGSIRLKNIYDGIEDYEMLNLLAHYSEQAKQYAETAPELTPLIEQAKTILAVPDGIVQDIAHYTRTPEQLAEFRVTVGELLEKLKRFLSQK